MPLNVNDDSDYAESGNRAGHGTDDLYSYSGLSSAWFTPPAQMASLNKAYVENNLHGGVAEHELVRCETHEGRHPCTLDCAYPHNAGYAGEPEYNDYRVPSLGHPYTIHD